MSARKVGGVRKAAIPSEAESSPSRRVGGVKVTIRRVGDEPTPLYRHVGGVKAPVARGEVIGTGRMQKCPVFCNGEYKYGAWIHSQDCPWAPVRWKKDGARREDWCCHFDCTPVETASCYAHHWSCPYWDISGATPF